MLFIKPKAMSKRNIYDLLAAEAQIAYQGHTNKIPIIRAKPIKASLRTLLNCAAV